MKITELRLRKLFSNLEVSASTQAHSTASSVTKAEGNSKFIDKNLLQTIDMLNMFLKQYFYDNNLNLRIKV